MAKSGISGRMTRQSAALVLGFIFSFMALAPREAQSLEFNLYGVEIFVDTTLSAGVSVRTAKRDNLYLPEANGGNREMRDLVGATYSRAPGPCAATFGDSAGAVCPGGVTYLPATSGPIMLGGSGVPQFQVYNNAYPFNFDNSLNVDDSRLNFDRGDATSAPFKMTNDIEITLGDFGAIGSYSAFFRVNFFYDAALDSEDSYERFGLDNNAAKTLAARDIELLDGYVSGDYEIFDYPLNLRGGRQVISWGESTFYLGGINVVNPIDVSAFRRPGSEVKDVLLPETAIYASMGLPYDLTVEAYYLLDWNPYELEPSGTPFQNTDFINPSAGPIEDRLYLSSSANAGTYRANCSGSPSRRASEVVGAQAGAAASAAALMAGQSADAAAAAAAATAALFTFPALQGDPRQQGSCAWARGADAAAHSLGADMALGGTGVNADGPLAAPAATLATAAGQGADRAATGEAAIAYRQAYSQAITRHLDRDSNGAPTGRIYDSRSRLYDHTPQRAEFTHRNPWGVNPTGAFPNNAAAIPASLRCGAVEGEDAAACQTRLAGDGTPSNPGALAGFHSGPMANIMRGLRPGDAPLTQDQQLYISNYLNRVTEMNTMPFTGDRDADDSGQWGIALRWYSEAFGSTEFGFYYQNYHSRLPLAQVAYYETPYVTLAKTGWTSASGAQLNGFGCLAGAGLGANPNFAPFISPAPTATPNPLLPVITAAGALPLNQRGFLTTGTFLDPDIDGLGVTTSQTYSTSYISSAVTTYSSANPGTFNGAAISPTNLPLGAAWDTAPGPATYPGTPGRYMVRRATSNPDASFRLDLDPAHFREAGIQTHQRSSSNLAAAGVQAPIVRAGLGDFLKYARFADATFNGRAALALQLLTADSTSATGMALLGTSAGIGPGRQIAIAGGATPEQAAALVSSNIAGSVAQNGPNRYDVARINCAMALSQVPALAGDAGAVFPTAAFSAAEGSEFLTVQHRNQLYFWYPEDIQSIGLSFATTMGDWGVQGEVGIRLDHPFQVDITEQIITAAGSQSVAVSTGDALRVALTPLGTQDVNEFVPNPQANFDGNFLFEPIQLPPQAGGGFLALPWGVPGLNANQRSTTPEKPDADAIRAGTIRPPSVEYLDVISAQIAFTNTFTRSNGFVDAVGGDLGILLINVAIEHVLDLPRSRSAATNPAVSGTKGNTLQAVCRSGTELPLGAILNLDTVTDHSCSPDATSMGYTIFGTLQYNNFWGTAWTVSPYMALRHDVVGNTPTPLATFREDRVSISLGFNGEYQNSWRWQIAYTDFFGEKLYNNATDRDFFSLSITYSF